MYSHNDNKARLVSAPGVSVAPQGDDPKIFVQSPMLNGQGYLTAWNATQWSYALDQCIPQLVAAQSAATPDAIALVMGPQQMTYGELNRRANQLAHHLQRLGVGADTFVGIFVERSFEMIVGLLGILKAGGVYVPLDTMYPQERIAFMLEDAQVNVLITVQYLMTSLPVCKAQIICLDTQALLLSQQSSVEPIFPATADNLAYIIYTSGSTGQPKGVQITHRSLLNLIFWHQRVFQITAADKATQLASPAFDALGWELWPYLSCGASVHLLDEETRTNVGLLRNQLLHYGITVTFLPTPLAEQCLTLDWPETTSLRLLLTGADTLHRYPPADLPFTLINNYGPTEATVVATSGYVLPDHNPSISPSIGYPIDNTQIYILDEQLQPVPIGEVGELYIGGIGLALGYHRRPELTAERFLPHPFSNEPNARIYKTGDLAYYLPDGQIVFSGRIDHQVKIRGVRIELGEIESALKRHPAVQQAAALAQEDTFGNKHLVAYIVVHSPSIAGEELSSAYLSNFLRTYLPESMIPDMIIFLDTLPLTPNGKVDRQALTTLRPLSDSSSQRVSPRSPLEIHVVHILAELLGIEQVGVTDNFFMLGGHSLLGTQIIARISSTFGVTLTLRQLFDAATAQGVAAEIEQLLRAKFEAMSEEEAIFLLEHEG